MTTQFKQDGHEAEIDVESSRNHSGRLNYYWIFGFEVVVLVDVLLLVTHLTQLHPPIISIPESLAALMVSLSHRWW